MRILLTGSIAIDRIMSFSSKFGDIIDAKELDKLSVSVLLNQLTDSRGGVAANIAYSLALLGEKPVLLGSVGQDAHQYIHDLSELGVQTNSVHYSALPTATFTVFTDQTQCQFGGFYPGAMSDAASLSLKNFSPAEYFVVLSPHDPQQMARQVAECGDRHFRLFYDVGQQASNIPAEDIQAGVNAAEVLIVNEYEMSMLVKKTGWSQATIEKKLRCCIVTSGEHGCTITSLGKKLSSVPAIKLDKVVDPTGAGDAFRAGFLYGYIREKPLIECAQLGSTAAAFAIEHAGTQSHRFTMEQFLERYQSHYGSTHVTTKN